VEWKEEKNGTKQQIWGTRMKRKTRKRRKTKRMITKRKI
jgi:hypothetical protein